MLGVLKRTLEPLAARTCFHLQRRPFQTSLSLVPQYDLSNHTKGKTALCFLHATHRSSICSIHRRGKIGLANFEIDNDLKEQEEEEEKQKPKIPKAPLTNDFVESDDNINLSSRLGKDDNIIQENFRLANKKCPLKPSHINIIGSLKVTELKSILHCMDINLRLPAAHFHLIYTFEVLSRNLDIEDDHIHPTILESAYRHGLNKYIGTFDANWSLSDHVKKTHGEAEVEEEMARTRNFFKPKKDFYTWYLYYLFENTRPALRDPLIDLWKNHFNVKSKKTIIFRNKVESSTLIKEIKPMKRKAKYTPWTAEQDNYLIEQCFPKMEGGLSPESEKDLFRGVSLYFLGKAEAEAAETEAESRKIAAEEAEEKELTELTPGKEAVAEFERKGKIKDEQPPKRRRVAFHSASQCEARYWDLLRTAYAKKYALQQEQRSKQHETAKEME